MDKACPVVIRNKNSQQEILVFQHPLAGVQIVKGTIEPDESGVDAARRELFEEAGITLNVKYQLIEWQRHPDEPVWGIYMMETGDSLPDNWSHYCEDDGGHLLRYSWHPLGQQPGSDWHPVFFDALQVIRKTLKEFSV